MLDRIEKIEEELNLMRYAFEFAKQFMDSEQKKTKALNLFIQESTESLKVLNDKITCLQESYVLASKNRDLLLKMLESQGRQLDTIRETLEILSKKK